MDSTGCRARPPGGAGDNKAPGARAPAGPADGQGGLSLWPAGQPWKMGNGAALSPFPTQRGLQPNPLCFAVQTHPSREDLLHWGGLGCPKPSCPRQDPPAPGHGSPGQSAAPPVRRCLSSSWDNGRQGERGEKKPWQFSAGFYLTWRQRAALCEGGTEAAHGNFLAFPLNRGFFTTSKFR